MVRPPADVAAGIMATSRRAAGTVAVALGVCVVLVLAPLAPPLARAQTVPRIGTTFAELTSMGGTIRGGGLTATVPPGVVPASASYSITLVPQAPETLPPPPAGLVYAGRPVSVLVQNAAGQAAALDQPLELRIPLVSTQPALPQLYVLVDRQWLALPSEVEGREVVGLWSAGTGTALALFLRPVPGELPRTGFVPHRLASLALAPLAIGAALLLLYLCYFSVVRSAATRRGSRA